jgi:hypothetical protein
MSAAAFPEKIRERIVDHLHYSFDSVKSLSLVSQAWHASARRRLWYFIHLWVEDAGDQDHTGETTLKIVGSNLSDLIALFQGRSERAAIPRRLQVSFVVPRGSYTQFAMDAETLAQFSSLVDLLPNLQQLELSRGGMIPDDDDVPYLLYSSIPDSLCQVFTRVLDRRPLQFLRIGCWLMDSAGFDRLMQQCAFVEGLDLDNVDDDPEDFNVSFLISSIPPLSNLSFVDINACAISNEAWLYLLSSIKEAKHSESLMNSAMTNSIFKRSGRELERCHLEYTHTSLGMM